MTLLKYLMPKKVKIWLGDRLMSVTKIAITLQIELAKNVFNNDDDTLEIDSNNGDIKSIKHNTTAIKDGCDIVQYNRVTKPRRGMLDDIDEILES